MRKGPWGHGAITIRMEKSPSPVYVGYGEREEEDPSLGLTGLFPRMQTRPCGPPPHTHCVCGRRRPVPRQSPHTRTHTHTVCGVSFWLCGYSAGRATHASSPRGVITVRVYVHGLCVGRSAERGIREAMRSRPCHAEGAPCRPCTCPSGGTVGGRFGSVEIGEIPPLLSTSTRRSRRGTFMFYQLHMKPWACMKYGALLRPAAVLNVGVALARLAGHSPPRGGPPGRLDAVGLAVLDARRRARRRSLCPRSLLTRSTSHALSRMFALSARAPRLGQAALLPAGRDPSHERHPAAGEGERPLSQCSRLSSEAAPPDGIVLAASLLPCALCCVLRAVLAAVASR